MDDESYIAIANVTKSFGRLHAVDNVSFAIRRGEFFSLLGSSGCGKTTLLRMLAGFEHPTEGEIYIDGNAVSGVPANRRPTNMVFQSYAIFPHLDVAGNIAYGLKHRNLGKSKVDAAVERALALIKMTGFGPRKSHQLSGGQRQRVALARALVCEPKVLLLDEPLGVLDKKLREEMQLELRALQRSVGITFIFVTHDQEEALTMSDRIAVMSKGKVLQIDTPANLYENPNCREVAGFIGNMNFLSGIVTAENSGTYQIEASPLGTFKAVGNKRTAKPGTSVTLAIRPEKINLSDTANVSPDSNAMKGKLVASSYLGDRSHYYVQVDGRNEPIAIAAQNVSRYAESRTIDVTKDIWINWRPDAAVMLLS